ncbi:hypothetical protein [Treponema sp. OMZ 857]|uniref:hypothetical protein n=1 Tax=Treponema sp. OMZ 857 TaxID=1643513 RepID=UPI0020A47AFB|nr:hypothetical protein [Treponema sp. OMZ 857]UTC42903.1 hypothetical protein E4N66_01525 [Treponema sp. OMZ 857]
MKKKCLQALYAFSFMLCIGSLYILINVINNRSPKMDKQLKFTGVLKMHLILNNHLSSDIIFYDGDAEQFSDLLNEIKNGKEIAVGNVPKCAMFEGIYYIELTTTDGEQYSYEMQTENIVYDITNNVFIRVSMVDRLRELTLLYLLQNHYSLK